MSEYKMTQAQLDKIMDACKPVPYLVACGTEPLSQQERANNAWAELGSEMGFHHMTVRPIPGKDGLHFTADAKDTP